MAEALNWSELGCYPLDCTLVLSAILNIFDSIRTKLGVCKFTQKPCIRRGWCVKLEVDRERSPELEEFDDLASQ